ncbi:MAG: RNA polymerase sigma factor [Blastocatellia bacterium]
MDETTFDLFYRSTARPLWAYIHRVSGDTALADDILQESYYRLLRASLEKMDEAQMKSYLYKIATNLLNDHWRSRKRERQQIPEVNNERATAESAAQSHDLAHAFEQLNAQQRSLLWLAYVEGNEHSEIAQILGLREKSIRVLLFRARHKLASILKQKDFSLKG